MHATTIVGDPIQGEVKLALIPKALARLNFHVSTDNLRHCLAIPSYPLTIFYMM